MAIEAQPPELDRLSISSAVVGIGKTREEYLKLFSRACISPQNDRTYSIPISGLYDMNNTSTSLILLNQRFRYSHLREKPVLEDLVETSHMKFDYESIIEMERPKPKPKPRKKSSSPNPFIDPYRHFESIRIGNVFYFLLFSILIQGQDKYWHNRRCSSSFLMTNSDEVSFKEKSFGKRSKLSSKKSKRSKSTKYRSPSAIIKHEKYLEEPRSCSSRGTSVVQRIRDMKEKAQIIDADVKQLTNKEQTNQRPKYTGGGSRRKLPLTQDQQLSLMEKYQIYNNHNIKVRRNKSYSQTLSDRLRADFTCKPQFRLNDSHEYSRYSKFLEMPHPVTSNSFSPRTINNKKQLPQDKSQKSFVVHDSKFFHQQTSNQLPSLHVNI